MKRTIWKERLLAAGAAAALAVSLLPAAALAADREYTASGATKFTFSDSAITARNGNDTGYQIDGTDLTIQSSGTYLVSGNCADGSIKIKKGTTDVTLVLDGLTLTSSDTAPIACNKSTEVTIVAASGTTNTMTDSAQNNDDSYPDNKNAENAVIKCKDGSNVTICGSGTLNIHAKGKNGIKSGAATDEEGDASLTIRDVTLTIDAPVNDAINAGQQLDMESGTLTISAGDDAIHCDNVLNVGASGTTGPTITITNCYEGLEAATLNISSGNIEITSEDDCLNAANSDLTNYDFSMTISGGTINAYSASGDGFDSNGDLTITGGTVSVWTANTADNQPLDADGTVTITGGTVLAAGGSDGMGMTLSAQQPCVIFGSAGMGGFPGMGGSAGTNSGTASGSISLSKGGSYTIQNASGTTVDGGTAVCAARYVFFSSSKLTSGASYTLSAGGTAAVTATAQTGSVSSGFPGGGQRPGGEDGSMPQPPQGTDGQMPAPPDGAGGNGGGFPGGPGGFTDVSESDWYYEAVTYAVRNRWMNGTARNTFSPNTAMTRGMLVTVLYRLAGSPAVTAECPFSDISSGSYCETAVAWAAANGIVSGSGDGRFDPDRAVTREQLAAILYRYAKSQGQDVSAAGDLSGFSDGGSVGSFAASAVAWANAQGLISGTAQKQLLPQASATRAQTAVILMRFQQMLAKSAS